jgi:Holliday junction resolvase YEN1
MGGKYACGIFRGLIRSPSSQILNKAGQSVSIAHLAVVQGFEQNHSGRFVSAQSLKRHINQCPSNRRAYRIGIDVSIWFHHAVFSKGGENPELRNLFFRLLFLGEISFEAYE